MHISVTLLQVIKPRHYSFNLQLNEILYTLVYTGFDVSKMFAIWNYWGIASMQLNWPGFFTPYPTDSHYGYTVVILCLSNLSAFQKSMYDNHSYINYWPYCRFLSLRILGGAISLYPGFALDRRLVFSFLMNTYLWWSDQNKQHVRVPTRANLKGRTWPT